ncbi:hypothetical protein MNBD_NITROSPINAE04-773 [hydrothermal vent metagenome]|uniref:Uncharacterized protein n=1 Tax=hydrothermal vent metagenome TaxID=652676 RepID=A0A3B1BWC9_9ZZZZ
MAVSASDNWKGSVKYWEKLAAIYSAEYDSNRHSYIYLPLADALANLGKIDKAIDTLEYGLAFTPGRRAAKVFLAQLYYDTGQEGKAKKLLIEVVDRWPDVLAAVSLLCKIYEKQGDIESAQAISRKVSYYYPDSPFVQKMADSYISAKEKETEVIETHDETEQYEEIEEQGEVLSPALFDEPASLQMGRQNEGAATDKKSRTLVALESMLDRITRIRNEGIT